MKYKHILVTGADGFIGSHLVEHLVNQGHTVRALSQYNSFNYWGWLEDVSCKDQVEVVCGDIRDPFFCNHITKDVEVVFHLAALIAIPYSYVAPQSYVETNITGTLNICQASLANNVKRVIHTSTSEVYGTARTVPMTEEHPLQPQSPYSASKIGADAMAMSYYHAFSLPITIARPFNTYGPRQSARAVIPTIISQMACGLSSIRLGDTSPTRDFNYVEDTCCGLYSLLSTDAVIGKTLNIGSNREVSIGYLFNTIKRMMGREIELIQDDQRMRPVSSEVYRLYCDHSELTRFTGYRAKTDLEAGLQSTIEWFSQKHNLKKYKTDLYNV